MKTLNKAKTISLSVAILTCLSAPVSHAYEWDELPADPIVKNYKEGTLGMGGGAIAGAVVAGPAGFVVGAIAGKFIGRQEGLENEINDNSIQLAQLKEELSNKNQTIALLNQQRSELKQNMMVASLTDVSMQSPDSLEKFMEEKFIFTINFKTNSDQVENHLAEQCREISKSIRSFPNLVVNLNGFADVRGQDEYNQSLSQRRLESVKQLLMQEGIPESAIKMFANGESGSLQLGDNNDGFSFDRRVVITLSNKGV